MSEEKKPSAAAMRATEKIFWLMQNCRPVRQEDRSVATIIDTEFAPMVEALRVYSERGHHDTCDLLKSITHGCNCGYEAALAVLEGK